VNVSLWFVFNEKKGEAELMSAWGAVLNVSGRRLRSCVCFVLCVVRVFDIGKVS
jgi:hypothetical protein